MNFKSSDLDRANKILSESVGMDAHVDTLQRLLIESVNLDKALPNGHVDYHRLRAGGVNALVCALWTPTYYPPAAAWARTFDLLTAARQFCSNSTHFQITPNVADALEAIRGESISMFLSLEGCDALEADLNKLALLREAGVSSVGLTHVTANWLADASTDAPVHRGISIQGRKAIEKMNSLGLLIDVSHSSDEAVRQVLEISEHPVIASHSCCRVLCDNPRNLPDRLIEGIAAGGGLICIAAHDAFLHPDGERELPPFVRTKNRPTDREALDAQVEAEHQAALRKAASVYATVDHLVEHIDHAVRLAGINGVAIGSDFDGGITPPRGFEDMSKRPCLAAQLLSHSYSSEDLQKLFGKNLLEILQQVQSG